jgi:hypothetical protein
MQCTVGSKPLAKKPLTRNVPVRRMKQSLWEHRGWLHHLCLRAPCKQARRIAALQARGNRRAPQAQLR